MLLNLKKSENIPILHLAPCSINYLLNLQYATTDLSYNTDFSHVYKIPQKQQIDSVIPSSLALWFLIFDHKVPQPIKLLDFFT